MGIAMNDVFTHGWDLARATGQPVDLDPAIATQLLGPVQAFVTDQLRGPDGQAPFGPAIEVPASSPAVDQLVAFLGRQP